MADPAPVVGGGAPGPADDVLEALHAVVRQVRALQHQHQRDAGLGLSPLEGRVLGYFARHPQGTLSELAAHSGRDKGQLARLVAGLRDGGWLLAEPDAQDRRVTRLRLSPRAEAAHGVLQAQRHQLLAQAAAGLSADERRQLTALLGKLRTHLDSPAGPPGQAGTDACGAQCSDSE